MRRLAAILVLLLLAACGSYDSVSTQNDLAIGVSNSVVIDETNLALEQRSVGSDTFGSLISCSGSSAGDPDLQYDPGTDRWFFTQMDGAVTANNHKLIDLAISQGATPLTPYACYQLDVQDSFSGLSDQPRLTVTGNKVAITTQQFSTTASPSATLIINKSDAVAAVGLHTSTLFENSTDFRPARNVTGDDPVFLVGAHGANTLRVRIVTGVPGNGDVTTSYRDVPVGYNVDGGAPAMSDPYGHTIVSGSVPTMHAAEVYGVAWVTTETNNGAGVGAVGLAEFTGLLPTFLPDIFQQFLIYPPDYPYGTSIGCATVTATASQDVVVGFSAASALHFLSAYMTGRHLTDPIGTLRPITLVAQGVAPSPGETRLDYCDAVTAPDLKTLWFALQYNNPQQFPAYTRARVVPVVPSNIQ